MDQLFYLDLRTGKYYFQINSRSGSHVGHAYNLLVITYKAGSITSKIQYKNTILNIKMVYLTTYAYI